MRVGNRQRAHWEEIWTSNLSIESDCTSFSSVFHCNLGNLFIIHSYTYRTNFQLKSINANHTMSTRWKIRWNRNRPNFRPVKLQFYHTPPHFRSLHNTTKFAIVLITNQNHTTFAFNQKKEIANSDELHSNKATSQSHHLKITLNWQFNQRFGNQNSNPGKHFKFSEIDFSLIN